MDHFLPSLWPEADRTEALEKSRSASDIHELISHLFDCLYRTADNYTCHQFGELVNAFPSRSRGFEQIAHALAGCGVPDARDHAEAYYALLERGGAPHWADHWHELGGGGWSGEATDGGGHGSAPAASEASSDDGDYEDDEDGDEDDDEDDDEDGDEDDDGMDDGMDAGAVAEADAIWEAAYARDAAITFAADNFASCREAVVSARATLVAAERAWDLAGEALVRAAQRPAPAFSPALPGGRP